MKSNLDILLKEFSEDKEVKNIIIDALSSNSITNFITAMVRLGFHPKTRKKMEELFPSLFCDDNLPYLPEMCNI